MKTLATLLSVVCLLGLATSPLVLADEGSPTLVQGEYTKSQSQLQAKLVKSRKALADLEAQRRRAVSEAQAEGQTDRAGIEALKRYAVLLAGRYVSETGEFQPGMQVDVVDVTNMNKLFNTYLHTTIYFGRVSAGHAQRTLDWGVRRLEDLARVHSDPSEKNNPDLEIIAKQVADTQKQMKTVNELATRMGVKLGSPDAMMSDEELQDLSGNRKPASSDE